MNVRSAVILGAALLTSMLIGGEPAQAMTNGVAVPDPAVAPWVATLAPAGSAPLLDRAGCGGVLVAVDRVLTAARCVDGIDPSGEQVHLGANPLSRNPGEVRGIRGLAVMPGYRQLPSPIAADDADVDSVEYDLAVIMLDRPVTDIIPLQLAWQPAQTGTTVAFFAHGLTGHAPVGPNASPTSPAVRDDVLHTATLTVADPGRCRAATPATVDGDSTLCAVDRAGSVTGCWLDAGSPAIATVDGTAELVGIYSFGGETAGRDCTPPAPAVFADVPVFRRWILGPLSERAPYPATEPRITRSGSTVRCAEPTWDTDRGLAPSDVRTTWVTLIQDDGVERELPVDGVDSTQLHLADDLNLHGNRIACEVRARSSGGYVRVRSTGLGV